MDPAYVKLEYCHRIVFAVRCSERETTRTVRAHRFRHWSDPLHRLFNAYKATVSFLSEAPKSYILRVSWNFSNRTDIAVSSASEIIFLNLFGLRASSL